MRNMMSGIAPSFGQSNKKKTEQTESVGKKLFGAGRLLSDPKTKSDPIGNIRKYAEEERKKKEAAKMKTKPTEKTGGIAPKKGFIESMMERFGYGSKKK